MSKRKLFAAGHATSLFLAFTFVLCMLFDYLFPAYAMRGAYQDLLPGFAWGSTGGFIVGLVESYLYGWYVVIVWGVLYRWFKGAAGTA